MSYGMIQTNQEATLVYNTLFHNIHSWGFAYDHESYESAVQ